MHRRIALKLRRGQEVSDVEFDAVFEPKWRGVSNDFWTPIDVASVAVQWLTEGGTRRVADVGSGSGKLCLVGALQTSAEFVGIEHRLDLVHAAEAAARALGAQAGARFLHARVSPSLLRPFDAFYLYNPFGENLHMPAAQLDHTVELSEMRYFLDITLMERVLYEAPRGTRVVTYHGFGGRFPRSFRLEREQRFSTDSLRLWVKHVDLAQRDISEVVDHVLYGAVSRSRG